MEVLGQYLHGVFRGQGTPWKGGGGTHRAESDGEAEISSLRTWLCWVLVVARGIFVALCGIFIALCRLFSCSMRDLVL